MVQLLNSFIKIYIIFLFNKVKKIQRFCELMSVCIE